MAGSLLSLLCVLLRTGKKALGMSYWFFLLADSSGAAVIFSCACLWPWLLMRTDHLQKKENINELEDRKIVGVFSRTCL